MPAKLSNAVTGKQKFSWWIKVIKWPSSCSLSDCSKQKPRVVNLVLVVFCWTSRIMQQLFFWAAYVSHGAAVDWSYTDTRYMNRRAHRLLRDKHQLSVSNFKHARVESQLFWCAYKWIMDFHHLCLCRFAPPCVCTLYSSHSLSRSRFLLCIQIVLRLCSGVISSFILSLNCISTCEKKKKKVRMRLECPPVRHEKASWTSGKMLLRTKLNPAAFDFLFLDIQQPKMFF